LNFHAHPRAFYFTINENLAMLERAKSHGFDLTLSPGLRIILKKESFEKIRCPSYAWPPHLHLNIDRYIMCTVLFSAIP